MAVFGFEIITGFSNILFFNEKSFLKKITTVSIVDKKILFSYRLFVVTSLDNRSCCPQQQKGMLFAHIHSQMNQICFWSSLLAKFRRCHM